MLWLGRWLVHVKERFRHLINLVIGNNPSVWIIFGVPLVTILALAATMGMLFHFSYIIGGERLRLALLIAMFVIIIFTKIAQDRARAKKDSAITKD